MNTEHLSQPFIIQELTKAAPSGGTLTEMSSTGIGTGSFLARAELSSLAEKRVTRDTELTTSVGT